MEKVDPSYALRCLTRSKAGGRYLSPNNDNLAWDRHGEALRTDATKNSKQAEEEDEGNDPAHHNEMFRVIHLVASKPAKDILSTSGPRNVSNIILFNNLILISFSNSAPSNTKHGFDPLTVDVRPAPANLRCSSIEIYLFVQRFFKWYFRKQEYFNP